MRRWLLITALLASVLTILECQSGGLWPYRAAPIETDASVIDAKPMREMTSAADLSMRDLSMRDLSMPDLSMPDLSVPDLSVPDLKMPTDDGGSVADK